jgi:hypothetical protein
LSPLAQRLDGAFDVDRVPEHDRGDDEIQPTRTMSLVLISPIAEFAKAVEEHGPRQGVSGLPLVQADVDPSSKVHVLQRAGTGIRHPVQPEVDCIGENGGQQDGSIGRRDP